MLGAGAALASPLRAQELGAYAAWLARDVDGMRSLKGGGAYVAVPALPFVDVRLDFTSVGRTRAVPETVFCGPYHGDAGNCVEEGIERDSRLSTLELGAVAWTRPVLGARLGFGAGAVRHGVSVVEHGAHTGRRQALLDGRDAYGASLSLHVRATPPFTPGSVAFISIHRSFVDHDGCASDFAGVCGGSGAFALRAGVGYRFGASRR